VILRGSVPAPRTPATLWIRATMRAGDTERRGSVYLVEMETRPHTLDVVARWLRDARSVTALTGAGISTDSAIPDFRGPQGLWTKDPGAQRRATLAHYLASRQARVEVWLMRMEHPARTVGPNSGHRALVGLERKGRLHTLVTQNIDGLHLKAGTSPDILVEIHGSMRDVVCMSCGDRAPMDEALARVGAGEEDPECRSCGGILKSATISFGQSLDAADLRRAQLAAAGSDVFVAVGTSLAVYPVAHLPQIAMESGARLVILNAEPTPYDGIADAVLRDPLSETLPELADAV